HGGRPGGSSAVKPLVGPSPAGGKHLCEQALRLALALLGQHDRLHPAHRIGGPASTIATLASGIVRRPGSRGAAAVGEFGLGAGDEFEEAGVAVLVLLARPEDRRADLGGIVDALAPAAEVLADRSVIAAEVAGPVLFVRGAHRG